MPNKRLNVYIPGNKPQNSRVVGARCIYLETGRRFKIRGRQGKYSYAEPCEYVNGMRRGDCWIVDVDGNPDPRRLPLAVEILNASDLTEIPQKKESQRGVRKHQLNKVRQLGISHFLRPSPELTGRHIGS